MHALSLRKPFCLLILMLVRLPVYAGITEDEAERIKKLLHAGTTVRVLSEVAGQLAYFEKRISRVEIVNNADEQALSGDYAIKMAKEEFLDPFYAFTKNSAGKWISLTSQLGIEGAMSVTELNPSIPESKSIRFFAFSPCNLADSTQTGLAKGGAAALNEESCISLLPGESGFDYDDMDVLEKSPIESLCPNLELLKKLPGGGIQHTRLAIIGESGLRDLNGCCQFNDAEIGFREGPDGRFVLIATPLSRDCFGGTAEDRTDEIFKLENDKLILQSSAYQGYALF